VAIGSGGGNAVAGREREIDRLHAEVGQLIAFSREVRKMTPRTAERSTIVPTASFRSDANPSCSASRLWCLSARHPPPTNDLGLMRRIDGLAVPWLAASATSTGKLFDFSTACIFDPGM
jgi:hypothetical protein